MSGYDAARLYNAIRLHFNNEKYNAPKYNYKTKVNFIPENQFYLFQKLHKLYGEDLQNFYISNFLENPKLTIFDLVSPECEAIYKKWKKRNDSLTYHFKEEVSILLQEKDLNELLRVEKTYPTLMIKTLQEETSIDTLLILDSILQFFDRWDKKIKEDIIWTSFKTKCNKYRCFMNIDVPKFKQILKKEVNMR